MFRWEKLGRVFNPADVPNRPWWMHEYAQAPCALLFDDFVRVYFSCRPPRDPEGKCVSYTAYVDFDRADLHRIVRVAACPILELGERGCFDEFGIYPTSVLRVNDEVWAYYAGHTRCESVPFDTAIGLAVSRDGGDTFQRLGRGPVLGCTYDEPFVLSGPKVRRFGNRFFLYYISGRRWLQHDGRYDVVYRIRLATSFDGLSWDREHRDLLETRLGENEVQASPDVIAWGGRFHMFFCFMRTPDFRTNPRLGYRIGYAVSDDLIHWERNDSIAGIKVSYAGFDNESIAYPHVFEMAGQLWMLYLGNEVGRYGFGLARLRGDS